MGFDLGMSIGLERNSLPLSCVLSLQPGLSEPGTPPVNENKIKP